MNERFSDVVVDELPFLPVNGIKLNRNTQQAKEFQWL